MSQTQRPDFFELQNGSKAKLPFSDTEYENRLSGLRQLMAGSGVDAMLLTSMHNIAYYSGFLYCSFGRPYACVVTAERCVTVSANIDGGQPWRRCYAENLIYTDWKRNNYWRAVKSIIPNSKRIGIEGDHMTLATRQVMSDLLGDIEAIDLNQQIMGLRMIKSAEEIELIKGGARTADIGGEAIRDAIRVGIREIDVAMAGRDAMELEISRAYPGSELLVPGRTQHRWRPQPGDHGEARGG
jgi:creatinase